MTTTAAASVAGGLTALLGVWMVVLAVTPGLRRRTIRRPDEPTPP
jgi:hypothetical protein